VERAYGRFWTANLYGRLLRPHTFSNSILTLHMVTLGHVRLNRLLQYVFKRMQNRNPSCASLYYSAIWQGVYCGQSPLLSKRNKPLLFKAPMYSSIARPSNKWQMSDLSWNTNKTGNVHAILYEGTCCHLAGFKTVRVTKGMYLFYF
jgi:hypothetical protein